MSSLRHSVIFKVALIIALIQTIIVLSVGYFIQKNQMQFIENINKKQEEFVVKFIDTEKNKAQKKELEILNALINSIEGGVVNALFNIDYVTIKILSKQLLKRENIKAISIYDTDTKSVFLVGYKKGNKIIFTKDLPSEYQKYNVIHKKLIIDGQQIGIMDVYYDMSAIVKELQETKNQQLSTVKANLNYTYMKMKENRNKILIVFTITLLFIVFVIVFVLFKLINNPLKEIKNGLEIFFKFLSNPNVKIKPIKIETNDEFGDIAQFTNEGIKTSSKLHREISELLELVDKYVPIIEFNKEGIISHVTTQFCKISGYKQDELIGFHHNVLKPNIEFRDILKYVDKNEVWTGEVQYSSKFGKYFWLHSNITKKCNEYNSCNYINIAYDISLQKEIEELKSNLEIIVESKTRKLKELHKLTQDSIQYASLIQHALLPKEDLFKQYFKDYFKIWIPKHIVGGDIYLLEIIKENEVLLMVIDCTGHGVPGAFVTVLVKAIERQILANIKKPRPSQILSMFNTAIKETLYQNDDETLSNVGFDGAILYYNKEDKYIKYSGANIPLYYVKEGELEVIKGDKYSVGYKKCQIDYKYKEHTINISDDMSFYISTDGYIDQIGETSGFPFGKKRFKELILECYDKPFDIQKQIFLDKLYQYKGKEEQIDDITVIGFKI